MDHNIGQTSDNVDEFELIEQIGSGGMGNVYRAYSPNAGEVAIKICKEDDEESIKRFRREVRAIGKITHENVMPIIKTGLEHNPPYYVMPLAQYSAYDILDDLVREKESAIKLFLCACHGVQAAHLVGECHRDIKPQNILILTGNRAVISDFGLAKFFDRDSTLLTKTMVAMGTELYMAPEQFLPAGTRDSDIRTDIFQLGKTLYQIYTGKYPAVLSSDNIPAGLWYVIQKATKQNPDERFQSVAELIDAIYDFIASQDPMKNPQEALSMLLSEINDRLRIDQYDANSVRRLIALIMGMKDEPNYFLLAFDKIPNRLLASISRDMPEAMEPFLLQYGIIIDENVCSQCFEYAEIVASKMSLIYNATLNLTIKSAALKSILCAAIDLNRYKAMSVFNKLLMSIKNVDEAATIGNMLRENISRYASIYDQVSKSQLHSTLQIQWNKAQEYINETRGA